MCILQWIRFNFSDPSYYTSSFSSICIPIHLHLLREISQQHPFQRPKVLDLLALSFDMKTDMDALYAVRFEAIKFERLLTATFSISWI
jgi:hypothetical protein